MQMGVGSIPTSGTIIMIKYIALLRGINVGGHNVKMDRLKEIFTTLGFKNIKTVIASGNVIFETLETNPKAICKNIESTLHKELGYEVPVLLRTSEEIKKLIAADPFKDIKITPETRLYVSFLSEPSTSNIKSPHNIGDGAFMILSISKTEVCSALTLSKDKGTLDLMKILEKEFGKKITTRNWKTITKLVN